MKRLIKTGVLSVFMVVFMALAVVNAGDMVGNYEAEGRTSHKLGIGIDSTADSFLSEVKSDNLSAYFVISLENYCFLN